MKRRTKIVCTLGPAVDSRARIQALIAAGMNVARLNCSHGDWDTRRKWIGWIRELSHEVGPVAILADLQGPKFRVGEVASGALTVAAGDVVTIGPGADLPIDQREMLCAMAPGDHLLLGDGEVELRLGSQKGLVFAARAVSSGVVKSHQGVTLVGKVFDVPCLTTKDLADLDQAIAAGVDFVALSYVHTAADLVQLREEVAKRDPQVRLCAKIETRAAVKALDEILEATDLVMVARGDMGLQMEIEEVPVAQKRIIAKCQAAGKTVITATQMLESMIHNARPTRAEATDVANAILDGTDAVMLSGETASGDYPIEAVRSMARIAKRAETMLEHTRGTQALVEKLSGHVDTTEAVAYGVAHLARIIRPGAILTTSTSGQTPRLVSKYRPMTPICCATWNEKTYRQMAVTWGVESVLIAPLQTSDEIMKAVIDVFLRTKRLKVGDRVVITAGVPVGEAGTTNLILVETVKGP